MLAHCMLRDSDDCFNVITVVLIMCCFYRGKIDDQVWRFLLTGGVALDNPFPNPAPEWLTEKAWSEVVRASNLLNLNGLKERK